MASKCLKYVRKMMRLHVLLPNSLRKVLYYVLVFWKLNLKFEVIYVIWCCIAWNVDINSFSCYTFLTIYFVKFKDERTHKFKSGKNIYLSLSVKICITHHIYFNIIFIVLKNYYLAWNTCLYVQCTSSGINKDKIKRVTLN